MKKIIILTIVVLVALLLGGAVGYFVAKCHPASMNREILLLHEGMERQARAYFRFLQVSDSGRTEEITKLRRSALCVLIVYTNEVDDLRAEYRLDWKCLDRDFYTAAKAYLAEHPLPAKELDDTKS